MVRGLRLPTGEGKVHLDGEERGSHAHEGHCTKAGHEVGNLHAQVGCYEDADDGTELTDGRGDAVGCGTYARWEQEGRDEKGGGRRPKAVEYIRGGVDYHGQGPPLRGQQDFG